MRKFINELQRIFYILLCVIAASVLLYCLIAPLDYLSCQVKWQDSGIEWRWDWLASCQLKTDDYWKPASVYRLNDFRK